VGEVLGEDMIPRVIGDVGTRGGIMIMEGMKMIALCVMDICT